MSKEKGVPGVMVVSVPKSGIKRAGTFSWGKVKMKTESSSEASAAVGQAVVRSSKNAAKALIAKLHKGAILPVKKKGPDKVSDG